MAQFTDRELHELFDMSLDDCYPMIDICGLEYAPSDALKCVDPAAYRCAFAEWFDAELTAEIFYEHSDGTYHDVEEIE